MCIFLFSNSRDDMQTVVLASNNAGKLREIHAALSVDGSISLMPQSAFAINDIEETGLTFVENAILKARNACAISGLPAIADDSGLIVDSLAGRPGIYSARYAGLAAADQDNINKLLSDLVTVPEGDRGASFYSVIVLMRTAEDPAPIICQGSWRGTILPAPQGDRGFGYDPIFYVPTHHCSAAQLELTEKNRISHRGQALAALKEQLLGML
jgi:XTP/dITP diphosphohydrolase